MGRVLLIGLLCCGVSSAQHVISARAGLLLHVEGRVQLDGERVTLEPTQYPSLEAGQTLTARTGLAELLLTPGAFLRLRERSALRLLSDDLTNARVELLAGAAMVEIQDLPKNNAVTLHYRDREVELRKRGVYRIDEESGSLRVYEGEARVTPGVSVKKHQELALDRQDAPPEHFDAKETDAFYRWCALRAAADARETGHGRRFRIRFEDRPQVAPEEIATGPAILEAVGARRNLDGLFALSGGNAAAAAYFCLHGDGTREEGLTFSFDARRARRPMPLPLEECSGLYLSLFGKGFGESRSVKASIGGTPVDVVAVEPYWRLEGVDQAVVGPLPRSLKGKGEAEVELIFDGAPSNPVTVTLR